MLETAWESRWLPGSLKKSLRLLWEPAGVAIRKWKMYLENCTQIVFLKRKATSDFYDKKRIETKSILPIASRKTKHEFLTHTPNVLYARRYRRQPFLLNRDGHTKVKRRRAQGGCLGTESR